MDRRPTAASTVLRERSLRRVLIAYGLFIGSEYGAWIPVLVWAYQRGGSREAGVIALAQLVPAAVAAPVVASIADRLSPGALLLGGYLVQGTSLALTAAAMALDAPALVWIFAIVAATAVVSARPAQAALLPSIVHRVDELGAANSVVGWIESAGIVVAGIASGLVIDAYGTSAAVAVASALVFAAAASVWIVRGSNRMAADDDEALPLGLTLLGGLDAIRENRAARVILGLQTAAWVVIGVLDILLVVLAIRILDKGPGWVGFLNTAYGFGGVVAGVAGAALIAVHRLFLPILAGAAALSVGLAALALAPGAAVAVVLLTVVGAGRVIFDVATRTLLQRIVPAEVVGRVFGVVEGVSMGGYAIGSITAPLLVWALGPTTAFAGAALILPAAALVCGRSLLLLDRAAHVPVVEIALLRALPEFRWLPAPALETAARALVPREFGPGDALIREDDPVADHYFVIASGEVDVTRRGVQLNRLGRGSGVGEIALLRSVPRTATVTANVPTLAYLLDRDSFLIAVTGHAPTSREVAALADARLAGLAPS